MQEYLLNDAVDGLNSEYLSAIPEEYASLGDINALSSLGIDALLGELSSIFSERSVVLGSFFLTLLSLVIIIALSATVGSEMSLTVNAGVSSVVSASVFISLYPLFTSVCSALGEMNSFFSALIPVLLSFLATGGGVNTALGASSGLSITLWITALLDGEVLLPVTCTVFSTSALSHLGGVAGRIGGAVKTAFTRISGAVGAVLAAVFALQTYISVSADSVGIRAAKYAASGLVPMVGATVSGALSTLVGGLALSGRIIGASSVAIIVAMALSPLVIMLAYKLVLFFAGVILDVLGKGMSSPITAFSSALDCLISIYVMTTIIYIFEIILLIWGGNTIIGA